MVVDVQDVYDEFGGGVFDPLAIQRFLAYAYQTWTPPAPAYVLLVGDGHYDFKDNLGRGEPIYIPPYLADVDPWISEVAADNRYVCVSGDDVMPDMHLGRLPVKTEAEVAAVVAKIIGYEEAPPHADWNSELLFVADNLDPGAGDFAALSDNIADNYLPDPYTADKVYYAVTHPTPAEARAAIIDAVNEGRLLVNYIGHAAIPYWAAEQLFGVNDIPALTNDDRLPFMVPMTCLDGFYIRPSPAGLDYSSLAEVVVRASDRGAIASWSPTGMGVASGHDYLNQGLFLALFADDLVRLGPATTEAKLYLYSQTGLYRELLDTYALFGDPATALDVVPADVAITKQVDPVGEMSAGDPLTYTLTFSNVGPATAHHVVITDLLPAALVGPAVEVTATVPITLRQGTEFVWDVADLAPGDGGVITITAVIQDPFGGAIINTAVIHTSATESNLENNIGQTVTLVAPYVTYLPIATKGSP
jgi:uncharacterized repeat protein (TIGR01451 family)